MPRINPVPLVDVGPALRAAIDRGRASRMLSSSIPVQIWAHRPEAALAWIETLEALHSRGLLPARLRELVRLKIASITNCQACQVARKSDDVTEADIACLAADDARFTAPERAALRFAELFASDYFAIDDAHFADLQRHFSTPQIVELNLFAALMLAGGRMTYVQRGYEEPDAADSTMV